jgi:hypothetical protein
MGMYGIIHTQPCGNMQISTWFLNITVCIGLEVEWGTQNISMWKPANFHVVFEYYCLYRVGSGMEDPKYL